MQIDNSFHRAVKDGDNASSQPTPFHAEFHPSAQGDDGAKVIQVRGELGRIQQAQGAPPPASRMEVPDPRPDFNSPDARVTVENNQIILHPYAGQQRLGDYPGGKGTDAEVEATRRIIAHLPGPGEELFELFDKNYNTRVGENHTPGSLNLSDAPYYGPDARYQLHFDVDLYARENHGPGMNARDMRPVNDVAPGSGKRPQEFWAVISDKNNTPLNVLEYDNPATGNRYLGQYAFQYDANHATVYHYVSPDFAKANPGGNYGRTDSINHRPNVLAGVTQYTYDANHKCTEARYYTGFSLSNSANPQPLYDMKFDSGRVDGTIDERDKAHNMAFFDLLGPRLPERPVRR